MADKCVVRNQAYRRGGLNKRERHNERKNADYMNGDIIPERAAFNVHYKRCEGGYEQAFDHMAADGIISTRGLPKDPNIVDELVFDVNTAYFDRLGGYEYAKSFFEEAYRLAVQEIGGEQFVLSAVMHADERNRALSEEMGREVYHYHLHVSYVPCVQKEIYYRKDNKNPELAGKLREVITQVSHSKKWPRIKGEKGWINSYSLLQDRFFEHMKAAGYTDIERGERGSTAEHLSVLEYKTQQEAGRAAALAATVDERKETAAALDTAIEDMKQTAAVLDRQATKKKNLLDGLEKRTAVAKNEAVTFADIDRMGEKRTFMGDIALSAADWKTVSSLAKEGVKSRPVIVGLKAKMSKSLRRVNELETKLQNYEGKSVIDDLKYYQARQRAPRRMAEAITDIMRKPPEINEPERTAPAPKRTTSFEI